MTNPISCSFGFQAGNDPHASPSRHEPQRDGLQPWWPLQPAARGQHLWEDDPTRAPTSLQRTLRYLPTPHTVYVYQTVTSPSETVNKRLNFFHPSSTGLMHMGGEGMVCPTDPKRRPPEQYKESNTPGPAAVPPPKPKVGVTVLTGPSSVPLKACPNYTCEWRNLNVAKLSKHSI